MFSKPKSSSLTPRGEGDAPPATAPASAAEEKAWRPPEKPNRFLIDDDDDVADSDAARDAPDFDVPARAPLAALLLLVVVVQQRDRADRATALARSSRRRIVEKRRSEKKREQRKNSVELVFSIRSTCVSHKTDRHFFLFLSSLFLSSRSCSLSLYHCASGRLSPRARERVSSSSSHGGRRRRSTSCCCARRQRCR